MQNVLDLHRLIMNTMEKSVWKGLKPNTNDNIDKGLYYLPRTKDLVFPKGVSFDIPMCLILPFFINFSNA